MSVKLLTGNSLMLLSLKGRYTGLSEATHVKIPHCGKSRVKAYWRYTTAESKAKIEPVKCILALRWSRLLSFLRW